MANQPFPGSDGDVLNPGSAERVVDKTVTRHYLYKPKDEEAPPEGSGLNWFEHNYKPRPKLLAPKLQIDIKPFADSISDLVNEGNFQEMVKRCQRAKIQVVTAKGAPIVTIRIIP